MKNKYIRKNKGFTLIELIVVMAIILVLSSFLVPKFNGYRKKAERLRAIDMGRQIYYVVVASYSENNGDFDKNVISGNLDNLLGLRNVTVSKTTDTTDNKINIGYKIDNKDYSMNFNDTENNITIKDKEKQIYPVISSGESDESN